MVHLQGNALHGESNTSDVWMVGAYLRGKYELACQNLLPLKINSLRKITDCPQRITRLIEKNEWWSVAVDRIHNLIGFFVRCEAASGTAIPDEDQGRQLWRGKDESSR